MKSGFLSFLFSVAVFFAACTVKNNSLNVKFDGALSTHTWPVRELNQRLPSDWSSYGYLTFEMKSSTTQRFDLIIKDTGGPRRLVIQPFQGVWIRASIPLINFQKRNTQGSDLAAIGKTARPGYWIGFTSSVGTITHIDSIAVSMRQPIGSPKIELRNVHLGMTAEDTILGPTPLVDEFGQWIPAEWTGKAKTPEELKNAWNDEEKSLQQVSGDFSRYGGFLETKVKPTGFFHVARINGIWWFVDPDGYLFFSTGSCGIGTRSEFARVKGREYIFKALPSSEDASLNASFYTWNLFRRFGKDRDQKWMDLTVRRMDNWGINTIGNWSDVTLEASHRKAYVATLNGWGTDPKLMGMADVYSADYIKTVEAAAERQCAQRKNDPYLLGYFIGNEPAWPNREAELVNIILSGDESPIKTALKNYLEAGDTPERRKAFVYETYTRFISIVNSAVKKYDPNHLDLGIRFGGSVPDDVIKASKIFDVFSINIYAYTANPSTLKRIYDFTGLPVIIGEFHFGTPGRGLAPGLAQTISQEERGVAYRYYVENAAANPALIGTHWFQWIDQPSTGRNDGENYNIGFLDVSDRPYAELTTAARETFRRLYAVHSGKEPPVARKALTQ